MRGDKAEDMWGKEKNNGKGNIIYIYIYILFFKVEGAVSIYIYTSIDYPHLPRQMITDNQ